MGKMGNSNSCISLVGLVQVLGVTIKDEAKWSDRSLLQLTAEYYQFFDCWLTDYFGGLQNPLDWDRFYIYLVGKAAEMINQENPGLPEVDVKQVLVPPLTDICRCCRLLYNALGRLRNAITDGQHRTTSMVELLTGFNIRFNSRKDPSRWFGQEDSHGGVFDMRPNRPLPRDQKENFRKVLGKLSGKVTVRVMMPSSIDKFEEESMKYSKMRATSVSETKPRVLCDV